MQPRPSDMALDDDIDDAATAAEWKARYIERRPREIIVASIFLKRCWNRIPGRLTECRFPPCFREFRTQIRDLLRYQYRYTLLEVEDLMVPFELMTAKYAISALERSKAEFRTKRHRKHVRRVAAGIRRVGRRWVVSDEDDSWIPALLKEGHPEGLKIAVDLRQLRADYEVMRATPPSRRSALLVRAV